MRNPVQVTVSIPVKNPSNKADVVLPPTLSITANPTSAYEGQEVAFTATASSASGIKSYLWTFKDGQTSTQQNPSHTFNTAKVYAVECTVTANDNQTTTKTVTVTVTP